MADQRRLHRPPVGDRQLPADPERDRRSRDDRLRGGASGLRLPLREPRLRARLRRERPRLRRAARRRDGEDGRQGTREGRDARRRRAARPGHRRRREPRRDPRSRPQSSASRCCSRRPRAAAARACASSRRPTSSRQPTELRAPRRRRRSATDRCTSSGRSCRPGTSRSRCSATRKGGVLTLGERECSIQRRHQKLIEESPSLALTPETREAMEASVERACRQLGYVNAGTFEFLLGPDGAPSFIEVNCRLQVEHPVTELTTGIDIVREQLRIAAGEPLAVTGRAPALGARDRDQDQRRGSHGATSRPPPARSPVSGRRSGPACGSTRPWSRAPRSRRTTTR